MRCPHNAVSVGTYGAPIGAVIPFHELVKVYNANDKVKDDANKTKARVQGSKGAPDYMPSESNEVGMDDYLEIELERDGLFKTKKELEERDGNSPTIIRPGGHAGRTGSDRSDVAPARSTRPNGSWRVAFSIGGEH